MMKSQFPLKGKGENSLQQPLIRLFGKRGSLLRIKESKLFLLFRVKPKCNKKINIVIPIYIGTFLNKLQ